jgi:mRNA interferase YafQ
MYTVDKTKQFRKDYKRAYTRGYDLDLIDDVIRKLAAGLPLPSENKDHLLHGDWEGYRECHITSNWLLVYKIRETKLVLTLTRTGTHSDLF